MEKLIVLLGGFLVYVIIVGLFISLLWNWTIPSIFPKAVETGYIAGNLGIFKAFGLVLICTLLFKPKLPSKE